MRMGAPSGRKVVINSPTEVKVLRPMGPNMFLLDDIIQCPPILESIDVEYFALKVVHIFTRQGVPVW